MEAKTVRTTAVVALGAMLLTGWATSAAATPVPAAPPSTTTPQASPTPQASASPQAPPAPNAVLDNLTPAEQLYLSCGWARIYENFTNAGHASPAEAVRSRLEFLHLQEESGVPEGGPPERRIPRPVVIQILAGALEAIIESDTDIAAEVPVVAGGRELGSVEISTTKQGGFVVSVLNIAPIGTIPCDISKLPRDEGNPTPTTSPTPEPRTLPVTG